MASKPRPPPRRIRALDDEGRGIGIELVGMRPDPAVLGLLEDEGERVLKPLPRAEPDVLARAHIDVRLEDVAPARCESSSWRRRPRPPDRSRGRRSALSNSVSNWRVTPSARARSCRMSSRRLRPMPQKPWPDERVTAAAVEDGDVVPVDEGAPDGVGALGIAGGEIGEGFVRQHDAPAERVVRPIALDDDDLVARRRAASWRSRNRARPALRRDRRCAYRSSSFRRRLNHLSEASSIDVTPLLHPAVSRQTVWPAPRSS